MVSISRKNTFIINQTDKVMTINWLQYIFKIAAELVLGPAPTTRGAFLLLKFQRNFVFLLLIAQQAFFQRLWLYATLSGSDFSGSMLDDVLFGDGCLRSLMRHIVFEDVFS